MQHHTNTRIPSMVRAGSLVLAIAFTALYVASPGSDFSGKQQATQPAKTQPDSVDIERQGTFVVVTAPTLKEAVDASNAWITEQQDIKFVSIGILQEHGKGIRMVLILGPK